LHKTCYNITHRFPDIEKGAWMGLRLMQLADHAQLCVMWEAEHMESSHDYLATILDRNPTTNFVYEEDNKILAAACGLYDGRRGMVQSVVVAPEARGKGYGKIVVTAVIEALLQFPISRVGLFVAEGNEAVFPFYEKLGFHVRYDATYMKLDLAEFQEINSKVV
jgi:N-acetylglutamate synthase